MEGERAVAPITASATEQPARGADGKLRVFVSYSRKEELIAGLEITGFQPYLDKHDIAPGEEWEARLGRLIEAADTVVFVISADAVASERCAWEVKRTTRTQETTIANCVACGPGGRSPATSEATQLYFFR
jgi:TIR domain